MTDETLEALLFDLESDRVERKRSISDKGRICEAICAFANDLPNHGQPGVLFIGVEDDGACAGIPITDELLLTLASIRDDGKILPLPRMTVQRRRLAGCDVAVVLVEPSNFPPIRYDGRTWVRIGPRRARATPEEEARLAERRRARDQPFDLRPMPHASISDLNEPLFLTGYLPKAVAPEVLAENNRSLAHQMAACRFVTTDEPPAPTVAGLLAIGRRPSDFIPGAYVQFLRIEGTEITDLIADQKEVRGPLPNLIDGMDAIIWANIRVATRFDADSTEHRQPDYPVDAVQQIFRNAVMHRDYENSNAPVRVHWFRDRIEIHNPGGPYGQVTPENFGQPNVTDYRNPNVAEAMRNYNYVQRFGMGITLARKRLAENGNPDIEFAVRPTNILATMRPATR